MNINKSTLCRKSLKALTHTHTQILWQLQLSSCPAADPLNKHGNMSVPTNSVVAAAAVFLLLLLLHKKDSNNNNNNSCELGRQQSHSMKGKWKQTQQACKNLTNRNSINDQ